MADIVRCVIQRSRPRATAWLAPFVLVAILSAHAGTCAAPLAPLQVASEIGVICHHTAVDDLECEVSSPVGGASTVTSEMNRTAADAPMTRTAGLPPEWACDTGPPRLSIVAIGISRT